MNRLVPVWPDVNENCMTPNGFGYEEGDQPCFSTEINFCSVYLSHKLMRNLSQAKSIFEQIIPTLKDM